MALRFPLQRVVDILLYSTSAPVFEARCAHLLEELPFSVFAEEGATVDLALLVSAPNELEGLHGFARTQRAILSNPEANNVAIGLDFKTMTTCCLQGKVWRAVNYQQQQLDICTALVVQNATTRDWIAVLPRHYIRDARSTKEGTQSFALQASIAWDEWAADPFGPEWSPFVMPSRFLPAACRSLHEFCQDPTKRWSNPYNGVVFNTPVPSTHPISIISPVPESINRDRVIFDVFQEAFARHSRKYCLNRFWIRPLSGDFHIINNISGERARVELKSQLGKLAGGQRKLSHYAFHPTDQRKVRFFTVFTDWDMLLTGLRKGGALLFWRDELPREWFLDTVSDTLEWTLEEDDTLFERRVLPMNGTRSFVERVERILAERDSSKARDTVKVIQSRQELKIKGQSTSSHREPAPIWPAVFEDMPAIGDVRTKMPPRQWSLDDDDADDGFEDEEDEDEDEEGSEDGKGSEDGEQSRQQRRGWSKRFWERNQRRRIMWRCMEVGYGLIYPLGEHPRGSHVFTPFMWTAAEQAHYRNSRRIPRTFTELVPETPMVMLNLAPVNLLDAFVPRDQKRANFIHVTHAKEKSLYLLDAAPPSRTDEPEDSSHWRFLVPSPLLYSRQLKSVNDDRVACRGSQVDVALNLTCGAPIDAFAVQESDIVTTLQAFFQTGEGRELGVGTEKIDVDQYLTNKRGIMQEWVSNREPYWRRLHRVE